MLFKSQILTQASGSVGGITASRNRGGPYFRARSLVVNPNSPAQVVVRSIMSNLVERWATTLTAAQRASWDLYAFNVPLIGPTGDPRNVGGIGMYVRANVPRLRAALSRVDTAPSIFSEAETPAVSAFTASSGGPGGDGVTITVSNMPSDGRLLLQVGRPQNPSVGFYKGPFVFVGSSGASPLTVPNAGLPVPVLAGSRWFGRARYTLDDGRLGPAVIVTSIAT